MPPVEHIHFFGADPDFPAAAVTLLGTLIAALSARRLARHDCRQHVVLHSLLGHHHFGNVIAARNIIHHG